MERFVRHGIALAFALTAAGTAPVTAQQTDTQPALKLPAIGTFARGGVFNGAITINRFERRGSEIVAVGFVSGVLSRGAQALGTGLAGEVTWPVRVSTGGVSPVSGRSGAPQAPGRFQSSGLRPASTLVPVQAADCPVVTVTLTGNTVDLLGVQVRLSDATVDLTGARGTPLGDLVCEASELVGNVAGVVNLLNNILALLTGTLGGLTGGVAGGPVIPGQ